MTLADLYPRLDVGFLSAVAALCARRGWGPLDLMAVMDFETGGTFSPAARNPKSSATGLIQFMADTARSLGTTTAALARMSAVEQLVYVERYLVQFGKPLRDVGDLYMAVFAPRAIGQADSFVLYAEGTKAYTDNRALDRNRDGRITRGEAVAAVAARRKNVELDADAVATIAGVSALAVAGVAGLAYYLTRRFR